MHVVEGNKENTSVRPSAWCYKPPKPGHSDAHAIESEKYCTRFRTCRLYRNCTFVWPVLLN